MAVKKVLKGLMSHIGREKGTGEQAAVVKADWSSNRFSDSEGDRATFPVKEQLLSTPKASETSGVPHQHAASFAIYVCAGR